MSCILTYMVVGPCVFSGSVNLKCDLSHPANLSANCLGFIANPSGNHAATRHFSLEKEALVV